MNYIADYLKDILTLGFEKVGKFYSTYRGFVYSNNDPEGYGRLQVSVPEVYGDMVPEYWAWPAGIFSGRNYGLQCLPQNNDLVWVTFERGNPRRPLWNYGYFAKGEIPSNLRGSNNIWFVTPQQNKILINDVEGTIKIISNTGRIIEINEKISLGKETESTHPVALGDTTQNKLESLIDILMSAKTQTILGPQPFLPDTQTLLQDLKDSLDEIKSTITSTE